MRKLLTLALAGLISGTAMLAPVTPSMADPRDIYSNRGSQAEQWRLRNRDGDRHGRWDRDDRRNWSRRDRDRFDDNDLAAGIVGLAVGTIAGAAIAGSSGNSHVARCEARYQSYDVRSDTYLGYDGYRHGCPL